MKVQLLQAITENGQLKTAKRRNKNWVPPKVENGQLVESKEDEFTYVPFTKGTEMEVSDTTGHKWIEQGLAKEIKPEKKDGGEPSPERDRKTKSPVADGRKSQRRG